MSPMLSDQTALEVLEALDTAEASGRLFASCAAILVIVPTNRMPAESPEFHSDMQVPCDVPSVVNAATGAERALDPLFAEYAELTDGITSDWQNDRSQVDA